ncbi:hypothetical protein CsatA_016000 [Cannabis sativa]
MLSNALPVSSSLHKRCVIDSPWCPLCKIHPETVKHALLDCFRSRKAWKSSWFVTHYYKYKHLNVYDFFCSMSQELDKDYIGILCCFLWAFWNQRNNIFHHKQDGQPFDVYDWSVTFFFKFLDAQQVPVSPSISNLDQVALQHVPLEGAFQIFTDAAIDVQRKKYSIGAVVLNHSHQVVAGLAKPFTGCVSPMVAEAKAVVLALQWASSIHLLVDILRTDCKSIVDKLYSCTQGCSILDDLIVCIKNLLSPCPNLRVVHVNREYNTLAHSVAKWGLGLDSEFIWNDSLPSI